MLNRSILSRTILNRSPQFNSTHGIKEEKKEYLSIIKNQEVEGLCWAYSLASTIEMSYALKTGNR